MGRKLLPAEDVAGALAAIDSEGFAILEAGIPAEEAAELAALVLACPERIEGVAGYEFAVCLLNQNQRFLKLMMHPAVLEITQALLGGRIDPAANAFAWPREDQIRVGSVDGLIAHAGSSPGWWHMDSPMGQLNPSRLLPDIPLAVNAIWALTPFEERTGATRVVPGSQHHRCMPAATCDDLPGQISCCAPAGSVVVVPNTVWHAAGQNRSEAARVAVACNYQPWWVGRLTMDVLPIDRNVWESLPPEAQSLTKHQLSWNTDFRGEVRPNSSQSNSARSKASGPNKRHAD